MAMDDRELAIACLQVAARGRYQGTTVEALILEAREYLRFVRGVEDGAAVPPDVSDEFLRGVLADGTPMPERRKAARPSPWTSDSGAKAVEKANAEAKARLNAQVAEEGVVSVDTVTGTFKNFPPHETRPAGPFQIVDRRNGDRRRPRSCGM